MRQLPRIPSTTPSAAAASPAAVEGVDLSSEVDQMTSQKQWQAALDPDNWGEAPDFQVDEDGMTVEPQRLRWLPIYMGEGIPYRCSHCHLLKDDHVRDGITLWCAEWRLRQLDGDR